MSKSRTVMFKCPDCGKEFEIVIYDSINVDLDPSLRIDFIFNNLYKQQCPHCQSKWEIMYPTLYHDMSHKFMVYFSKDASESYFKKSDEALSKMMGIPSEIISGRYNRVGALHYETAIDKVIALENNLDHRVLTIYRKLIEDNFRYHAKNKNLPDVLYSLTSYRDTDDKQIVFKIILNNKETDLNHSVNIDFKIGLYEEFKEYVDKYLNPDNFFIFEEEHAHEIIMKYNKDSNNK